MKYRNFGTLGLESMCKAPVRNCGPNSYLQLFGCCFPVGRTMIPQTGQYHKVVPVS